MPYFHIGADEAFQVASCMKDIQLMNEKLGFSRDRLMLRHIAGIANHVHSQTNAKVLMWHDMLKSVNKTMAIAEYKLDELVEPVVWDYAWRLGQLDLLWKDFAPSFPNIWGASVYKGADGPSRYYSNIPVYLQNNKAWQGAMDQHHGYFENFRGMIICGWQRYDHFAVLCELLPVGLMSAVINFLTIRKGCFDDSVLREGAQLMHCETQQLNINAEGVAGQQCVFPGSLVYQHVQDLHVNLGRIEKEIYGDYRVQGWLSPFNIKHNYTQNWYLNEVKGMVQMHTNTLGTLISSLRSLILNIFIIVVRE
uniref:Beta-N-acetylhexosaminidase n=1 Tax=Plectus sambesii TaxID=2011161 RepID=A0A914UIG5_9BILA